MNLVKGDIGIVSELDPKNMLIRVEWPNSNVVSPWLMVCAPVSYYMPVVGDQVVCFYDEYRRQGVAIGLARKEGDVPFQDSDIVGIDLGTCQIKLSRSTGSVTIISDNEVLVQATKVTIDADEVEITKKLTVAGEATFEAAVTADSTITATGMIESKLDVKGPGVLLTKHIHPTAGVGAPTLPPTPTV